MLTEVAEGGPGWWQVWGSSVLPVLGSLVVSLVALAGVIWSTRRSAAATVEAEDRRAVAAIEAEDRRHEHALEADRARRVAEARHLLYVRLESARAEVAEALSSFRLFAGEEHFATELMFAALDQDKLHSALATFGEMLGESRLYATRSVNFALAQAYLTSAQAREKIDEVMKTRDQNEHGPMNSAIDKAQGALALVTSQMRRELGSDETSRQPPNPPSSEKADSAASNGSGGAAM